MVAEAPRKQDPTGSSGQSTVTYVGPSQAVNHEGTVYRPGDELTIDDGVLQSMQNAGHQFEGDGISTSGLPLNPDASKEYLVARHDAMAGGGSVTIEPPDAQGPDVPTQLPADAGAEAPAAKAAKPKADA